MDHFIDHLNRWFESLFGPRPRRRTPPIPGSPSRSRYEAERAIAHECGHAGVAWMSHVVVSVEGIRFFPGGGAETMIAYNRAHSDYDLERCVTLLGGLAGEMLVWKKASGAGFGGRESADLPQAFAHAEAVLGKTTVPKVESLWRTRLAEPSFDVALMFSRRPPKAISALLNLSYRRAKQLLQDNRPGFDRLCRLAAGHRDLTRAEIESQFGPRPWAPGGR